MERVPRFRFLALTGAALLLAGSITPARAQADPDDVKRGVARISLMDGDVTVRRGDSGDWVAGVINAPLMTGDQVATAANSRTEIQFDAANALRMGGDASVRIAQLEYDRYQFQVARGTVTYRVLRPTNVNIEVDTQNLAVRPSKEGVYRIRVDDAGQSEITVRLGSVEVSTTSGSQWVNAGQTLLARGPAGDPEFKIAEAIPIDDWDHWNESRDQAELASVSDQYVPPGVTGAEDLDQYGTWSETPDYGYVWQPNEPVGWSPYSVGQWTWLDWYGWTWVGYEPWGWAPYHYGRWFNRPGIGWAWYPGARFTRHYWSPGLVAFVGWGGAGFGLGYVGWIPLAPYEVLRPWWGRAYYGRPAYINRSIGVLNVNVASVYKNAAVVGGVNGVRGADFQGGRFQGISHFSGAQIRDARVALGPVPMVPGSANLRFTDRMAAAPSRAIANTQFFAREQPKPAEQIPFAQQQRAFQAARVPPAAAPASAQNAVRQGTATRQQPAQSGGWHQYGDRPGQESASQPQRSAPAQTNAQATQNPAAKTNDAPAQQSSGWQRFGAPGTETDAGGRPAGNAARPSTAQPGGSSWNRFGTPGNATSQPRPQPAPTPQTYRAPQYTPAPAPRTSAPAVAAPSRSSAPSGGSSHGGGGGGGSHGGGGHR
jgi:uncharacterized membrane protein YgcG